MGETIIMAVHMMTRPVFTIGRAGTVITAVAAVVVIPTAAAMIIIIIDPT